MRRPDIVLAVIIVLLLAATGVLFSKYWRTSAEYRDLKAQEETAESRYSDAIDAIGEIQDSLNAIAIGDTTVGMLSSGLRDEQRIGGRNDEALDRIAVLRAGLERTKVRIQDLESSLSANRVRLHGMERVIGNLKRDAAAKEAIIDQLTGRVDSLQTQVTGLTTQVVEAQDTVRAREQQIEEKRRELATVFYAVGSKHSLTSSGLIVAKGGVFGLGKTLEPSGNVNDKLFTPLDTDHDRVIHVGTPKAQVLTAQPSSSYELRLVAGKLELHILDPVQFRKVRHVVIMTG